MNNMFVEELFYLATFPLLLFIIHYFFSHFFICRMESRLWLSACYMLYFTIHTALHFSPWSGSVLLLLNTGLIVLLSCLYRGDLKWRVCTALFMTVLILLSDAVIQPIYSTSGYVISLFITKLLIFMLVYISVRIARTFGDGNLAGSYWLFLFFCPIISILGVIQLSDHPFFRAYPIFFPISAIGLLIINFLVFLLCDRVLQAHSAQHKSRLLEQQMTYYVNQYQFIKERHEETVRFQHDFKNILLGLHARLQSEGENTSKEEIEKLLGHIGHPAELCNSGNLILDAMLNYKAQTAKRIGIPFLIDLNIPPHLVLDAAVISVVLGNALDNAIEAVQKMTNEDRYIQIQMHYLHDSLFMRMQNPYIHEIRTNRQGELYSTKPNAQGRHGLGLRNIKKIVNDNNGLVDISYRNQLFQLEIVLFNIERQQFAPA